MKTIGTLVIIAIIVYALMGNPEKQQQDANDKALQDAYNAALGVYNHDVVANAERIHRLETHDMEKEFTFQTGGAGMYAFDVNYPYGWNSMMKFWDKNPQYKPLGTQAQHDGWNTVPMIVFPSLEAGIMTLCYFLNINKNNAGKWHSKNESEQIEYSNRVNQIQNGYVL